MLARREAEGGVFSQEALVGGQTAEMEPFVGVIQGQFELAAPPAIARAGRLGRQPKSYLPEPLPPGQAKAVAPADPHQRFDCGALELGWRAANEVTDALERAVFFALCNGCRGGLFAPVADETKPDPNSSLLPAPYSLHSAPDVALIDVRQPHLDAVPHGVAAERIHRVEPHRLIIEKGDVVLDWVVVPEPGGLVREQPKRGSV